MKTRREGFREFRTEMLKHKPEVFPQLAATHKPETLMISCSDSRVSPSVLTKAALGTLFLVRTAGNIVPPRGCGGERASIEYAVEVLGVREIIVMGHSHCGAMGALVDPSNSSHLKTVHGYLKNSASVAKKLAKSELSLAERQTEAARLNARLQLRTIAKMPCVKEALAKEKLRLLAWFFNIEEGQMYEDSLNGDGYHPLTENEQHLHAKL